MGVSNERTQNGVQPRDFSVSACVLPGAATDRRSIFPIRMTNFVFAFLSHPQIP
jgi:hypothetical protein